MTMSPPGFFWATLIEEEEEEEEGIVLGRHKEGPTAAKQAFSAPTHPRTQALQEIITCFQLHIARIHPEGNPATVARGHTQGRK